MLLSLGSHRGMHGQRAERVPPAYEGLAEERDGHPVRARRGEQPADREAEAQGEETLQITLFLLEMEQTSQMSADYEEEHSQIIP